jgi:hypothetical protein
MHCELLIKKNYDNKRYNKSRQFGLRKNQNFK